MRVDWVSLLPPFPSEIAHYTARLLPSLAREVEVRVWTGQERWDPAIERHARVFRLPEGPRPWAELNAADITVFHIGNDPATPVQMVQSALEHPGLVVLHDLRLQHLLLGFARLHPGAIGYAALMESHYGRGGAEAARAASEGEVGAEALAERYPLFEPFADAALGVLVHSREAFDAVSARRRGPVTLAPLPHAARLRGGPARVPFEPGRVARLVVFGHLGPNRRLESLLDAMGSAPLRGKFSLEVYGRLWSPETVARWVRERGLEDRVALRGFVDEEALDRALAEADLAVNLRNPTMGEASASQLRIWEHALPSLVSRTGWYATLPPETVSFVRPESEVEDLRALLGDFLTRPEVHAAAGRAGRRLLEESHGPAAYLSALLALAASARRAAPAWSALHLARRAARLSAPWTGSRSVRGLAFQGAADRILELAGSGGGPAAGERPPGAGPGGGS